VCLKHLDLCSGIGGFALGLQKTGYFKTIGFCEIDPFCQKVLKKNFPGVPIYSDIKKFKPNDEGLRPDVITSGFPCQSFSTAGRMAGGSSDKNLWKETFRIIKECRPSFFVGENVGGIVKLYLDTILEDLESEGYSQTRCFNISASSIGANHQRARIWIVANSVSIGTQGNKEMEKELSKRLDGSDVQSRETFTDSLCEGLQGHDSFPIVQNENNGFFANSVDEAGATENWWEAQSKLRGIPDGLRYGLHKYRTNRIMALGNAVCPQIPFLIGKAIGKLYE
jgi:DNA (cytosine-5)-methyltransferase 1